MCGSGQSRLYSAEDVNHAVQNARNDYEKQRLKDERDFIVAQHAQMAEAAQRQAQDEQRRMAEAHRADLAEMRADLSEQQAKRARMDAENTEKIVQQVREAAAQEQARFQLMMEEMRESKGEEMAKLEVELAALRHQIAKDAEEMKEHKDPKKYEEVQKTRFNSFLSYVKQAEDPPKTSKPSIAILGNRGVGKSSTCNALSGDDNAITGCVATTMVVTQVYGWKPEHKFEVWDVPGETDTRSYANLEHLMKMKTMHVIIVQYTESIKMALNLIRLVAACRVPLIIVRNKVDQIEESDAKKEKMSLEDFRKHIKSNEEKTLMNYLKEQEEDVGADDIPIIFASTKIGPDGLGVSTLKKAITSVFGCDVF